MPHGTVRPHPKRVLVVDDDADWRELMTFTLEELGYEPLLAADGKAALELLRAERVDVVLLDLCMPGLSGEQVAQALPKSAPPVVFLTSAEPGATGSAMAAERRYYLPKAATHEQLSLLLSALTA